MEYQIRNEFPTKSEMQSASDQTMLEFLTPAEDVKQFSRHLVGKIQSVALFRDGKLMQPAAY